MTIAELVAESHATAKEKGWYADRDRNPLELIALVHSELSEAVECARDGQMAVTIGPNGKPEGFPIELADAVIRIADMAGHMGIDLQAAILAKMDYNWTRPARHGGKLY